MFASFLIIAVEDVFQRFRTDAVSGIRHIKLEVAYALFFYPLRTDGDMSFVRVFQRIRYQVVKNDG